MRETSNYQLPLWDAADRILREDFNRNNGKIDATIAEVRRESAAAIAAARQEFTAVAAAIPYLKIFSVTTTAAVRQVDVNLGGVDWRKYAKLELFCQVPPGGPSDRTEIALRVNNLSSNSYTTVYLHVASTETRVTESNLGYLTSAWGKAPMGGMIFYSPMPGNPVTCLTMSAVSNGGYNSTSSLWGFVPSVNWSALSRFSFYGVAREIPVGSTFTMYGVKK